MHHVTKSLDYSAEGGTDFFLSFTHTDGNFDKGVRDSFVGSELHQIWSHWDTELFGHIGDLIELWLSAETRGKSV